MSGLPFAIDHLMVRVPDSEVAGRVFETLGFSVTPRSLLPGMSNRLVCFAPQDSRGASFIELIAVDDEKLAPPAVLEMLGENMGPAAIVVATGDARALAGGIGGAAAISPPLELARDCDLGAGVVSLSFSVIVAKRAGAPLGWSAIQHKTPQYYRIPQFVDHRAGDFRMTAVIAVSADPSETASALQKLWGGSYSIDAGCARFVLGSSELRIHTAEGLKQVYAFDIPISGMPVCVGLVLNANAPDAALTSLVRLSDEVTRLNNSAVLISKDGWRCLVAVEPKKVT